MITIKFWCTKCDILMEVKGTAMDCPIDGTFIICPSCKHRIVFFIDGHKNGITIKS